MGKKRTAIVLNERDNVATVLEPLGEGSTVSVEVQGQVERITLVSDIPMGHKFALRDIEKGSDVIKYGEPIGQSAEEIACGEHVHVHNVVSHSPGGTR
jgi:altronate dehydratase small subunit